MNKTLCCAALDLCKVLCDGQVPHEPLQGDRHFLGAHVLHAQQRLALWYEQLQLLQELLNALRQRLQKVRQKRKKKAVRSAHLCDLRVRLFGVLDGGHEELREVFVGLAHHKVI